MTTRLLPLVASISFLLAGPVPAQGDPGRPYPPSAVKRYQFNIDIGLLEGGIGYAERLGAGPLSFGVGLWFAWEPAEAFDRRFFEARGVEPFVRYQARRGIQAELGPSFLRYATGDDCSDCTATFIGLRAAALAGGRRFLFGPAIRYGLVTGSSTPTEMGFVVGLQVRYFLAWEATSGTQR